MMPFTMPTHMLRHFNGYWPIRLSALQSAANASQTTSLFSWDRHAEQIHRLLRYSVGRP
jgi:hypothetical protein